jgi:outer membrane protein assembly factor BamB
MAKMVPTVGLLLLLALLLSSCGDGGNWVQFRGDLGRGYTRNGIHPPLGTKWKLELQDEQEPTQSFNPPVVKDDTIYFGSPDGNFYALDLESGYMRWIFKTDGIVNSVPYADERYVYFGSNDGKVYAVSRETGEEAWSYQTESTVQSTIVKHEDTIVFASDGGSVYFLSEDGVLKHRLPNPVWHRSTFQVLDETLYLAPGPRQRPHALGAYDMEQDRYRFILDTSRFNAVWYSFPALSENKMFMSTAAYRGQYWRLSYYAFDRETGEELWSYTEESTFGERVRRNSEELFRKNLQLLDYMAPVVWRDLVIYTSGDSVVRAFDQDSGNLAWRRRFAYATSSAPIVSGDRLYFGLYGDPNAVDGNPPRLISLSAANGRKQWEMDLEGALLSAPVIAGEWLVFGTDQNIFYVLEELY